MLSLLHTLLPRVWLRRGPIACLLWPLSWLYGQWVARQQQAYRSGKLASGHPGVPVIVVGNVVAGGAGKTPTTIALVQYLLAKGVKVGVVSRGHGRSSQALYEVHPDSPADSSGDEPLLIRRRTGVPVWVGAARLKAAMALRQAHPEVALIVCDDGLQHLALQRDLEICVMDDRGAGNGWLLPAGPLREPWPRQVDVLLYTDGVQRPGAHTAQRKLSDEAINGLGQRQSLSGWRQTPVDALAALARPQAFFAMLRQFGLTLARTYALPDHAPLRRWPAIGPGDRPLLCTEKDAVKLWAHCPQAWAVPLQLSFSATFLGTLDGWLRDKGLLAHDPRQ